MAARSPPSAHKELSEEDEFIHQIAIDVSVSYTKLHRFLTLQMSRVMNIVNPNDLLARRIIDIAKGNRSSDAFLRGKTSVVS